MSYQKIRNISFRTEIISSLEGLLAIRKEWEELWDRCPGATPFQLPGWLIPWCRYFCGENEILTIALRKEERLAALAPLLIEPSFGEEKERRLVFMGTGISDYLDVLADPEGAEESVRLILSEIRKSAPGWDICHLEELRESSHLLAMKDFGGLGADIAPMSVCPVLVLPSDPERLEDNYPREFHLRLKRAKRSLLKEGSVVFGMASALNMPEFLEQFFQLYEKWWSVLKREEGGLSGEEIRSFHREAAEDFLRKGILRLYGLKVNGKVSAITYGFLSRGRFYSYLAGFDPALERLSPGSIAIEYAIRDCIREGAAEFDFLRGGEKYKYNWGARDRVNYRLQLFH
jgi:CelD/BcsL family acetyltransferase involved in cellulose biosynthesis